MNCVTSVTGIGVGLTTDSLLGSAIFVVDTRKNNAFIQNIRYNSSNFASLSANIQAFRALSNYECSFGPYIAMPNNPQTIGSFGRYVKLLFTFSRNSSAVPSPRVYDVDVNFIYNQFDYTYKSIYKIKSDIFGFEYALLKPQDYIDSYNHRILDGEVIVKTLTDKNITLSEFIPDSYLKYQYYNENYPDMFYEMSSGVKDIEVFYDTLMFITSSYVIFEKATYNFEDNVFSIDDTGFRVIGLKELNAIYGDVWFFEDKNSVLTFIMQKAGNVGEITPLPKCFRLDVMTGKFEDLEILNLSSLSAIQSLAIRDIEMPVVTYDSFRNNFNLGVAFYNTSDEFHILSMNLEYDLEKLRVKGFDVISPVDYSNM